MWYYNDVDVEDIKNLNVETIIYGVGHTEYEYLYTKNILKISIKKLQIMKITYITHMYHNDYWKKWWNDRQDVALDEIHDDKVGYRPFELDFYTVKISKENLKVLEE